jgi:hypothetical protein
MAFPLALRLASASMVVAGCTLHVTAIARESNTLPPSMRRFLSRADEPVRSYRALRRLEGHNKRYNKHGWVEAWTTLDPQRGFAFDIAGEGGSSYVREKVLRKTLEREREAHARRETASAALDEANYEFTAEQPAEGGLVSVTLKPRRQEALLLAGSVYLTADDADLVRVEGFLVKKPSFWTRRVHVVRKYGRLGDVRVPMALESTAQIVLAGESTFSMHYEYASINGRDVGNPQPRAPERTPEPKPDPKRVGR